MLLPKLREEVLEANLELVRRGLVLYTFGNSSGISREDSLLVIKPSGVPYETMKPEDLVVTAHYVEPSHAPRTPRALLHHHPSRGLTRPAALILPALVGAQHCCAVSRQAANT